MNPDEKPDPNRPDPDSARPKAELKYGLPGTPAQLRRRIEAAIKMNAETLRRLAE